MRAEPNAYSRRWFEFFHIGIDEARTIEEATFVCRCAPLPDFRKVGDVCCGMGRHARALSRLGYSVIGVDRHAHAIAKAREEAGGTSYVHADIREYPSSCRSCKAFIVVDKARQFAAQSEDERNPDVQRSTPNAQRPTSNVE